MAVGFACAHACVSQLGYTPCLSVKDAWLAPHYILFLCSVWVNSAACLLFPLFLLSMPWVNLTFGCTWEKKQCWKQRRNIVFKFTWVGQHLMPLRTQNYHWHEVSALENEYCHLIGNNQAAQDHCLSAQGFYFEIVTATSLQKSAWVRVSFSKWPQQDFSAST